MVRWTCHSFFWSKLCLIFGASRVKTVKFVRKGFRTRIMHYLSGAAYLNYKEDQETVSAQGLAPTDRTGIYSRVSISSHIILYLHYFMNRNDYRKVDGFTDTGNNSRSNMDGVIKKESLLISYMIYTRVIFFQSSRAAQKL